MDNSDDEQLTLRDKIALSLLAGHMSAKGASLEHAECIVENRGSDLKTIEIRVRAAYKVADIVRKIRLESFS